MRALGYLRALTPARRVTGGLLLVPAHAGEEPGIDFARAPDTIERRRRRPQRANLFSMPGQVARRGRPVR
jgi:hypothetical protein